MFRNLLRLSRHFSQTNLKLAKQKVNNMIPVKLDLRMLDNNIQDNKSSRELDHNILILEKGYKSAEILNKYDSQIIDAMCKQFLKYTAQDKVKKQVTQNISNILNDNDKAKECVDCLEVIYGILEQSNYILKGDIHSHSLHKMESVWKQIVKKHQKNTQAIFYQKQMFQLLFDSITSQQNFRLPKLGIYDNKLQNQKNLFERQLILESECSSIALKKFLKTSQFLSQIGRGHTSGSMKKQLLQWLPDLVMAIKQKQQFIKLSENKQKQLEPRSMQTTILRLQPSKLASICLVQFLKQILQSVRKIENNFEGQFKQDLVNNYFVDEIIVKTLSMRIGNAIKQEIQYQNSQNLLKKASFESKPSVQESKEQNNSLIQEESISIDKMAKVENEPVSKMNEEEKRRLLLLKLKHKAIKQSRVTSIYKHQISSNTSSLVLINPMELGFVFANILKDNLKIKNKYDVMVPLIDVKFKSDENQSKTKYFTIHNALIDKLSQSPDDINMLHLDKALPMIMKPAKWIDFEIGGYYLKPTNMVRIESSEEQQQALKYADLGRTYKILDVLSATPWKVNKKVLNVAEQIWNFGEGASCIPSKKNPDNQKVYHHQIFQYHGKERLKIMKQLQKQKDIHGAKCDFLLKLGVVKAFQNVNQFYFPMSLDFRGRVYPVAPHFNHIGADLSRGLLKFGQKKKIEARGLKWLRIHCANLMGLDKKPIPDKLTFIDNNMDLIKRIAEDPLKNREWMENEDCWQLLATIFQLTEAMSLDNPEQFMSDLHIHQDGSCNGLQHYAALGRDAQGASQVNLDRRELPGDVYTHVGKMVQEKVIRDAENPDCPQYALANILKSQIKRKTIKQTVMTSVYGVTFIGARGQIGKQLKDQKIFSELDLEYKASVYLAKYTLECLANLFSGANAIKKWLIECAGIICRTGSTVGWITPYGLPVIQPYRTVNTSDSIKMMCEQIEINKFHDQFPVNKTRQKSAFPPNFIHSLDSSHMIFTAEQCHKRNIAFAAVHDSYWTHPSTVDQMNEILREQFINLHSQPLLQNLRASFQRRFPLQYFPPVPIRGNFNLQKVRQSIYFFS